MGAELSINGVNAKGVGWPVNGISEVQATAGTSRLGGACSQQSPPPPPPPPHTHTL